jgi:hypothetical protein
MALAKIPVVEPLPERRGTRPRTHLELPHSQLDQQPTEPAVREELAARAFSFAGVREEPSGVSVPGARALVLDRQAARGPAEAFLVGREFAHLHPGPDLSLHLALPEPEARQAIDAGWAEWHPLAAAGRLPKTIVMVYAPRDEDELEVVWSLLRSSHGFATGRD